MGEIPWREVLPADDYGAFRRDEAAPLDLGAGPGLLVVDAVRRFVGDERLGPERSRAAWPLSCGPPGWAAVGVIRNLLDTFRHAGQPIVFTTGQPELMGSATRQAGRDDPRSWAGARDFPPEIAPRPDEIVLPKTRPSAFFATPLVPLLHRLSITALVVVGGTTSGCVRASVVDGHSYGWPIMVAEDAVFDRSGLSHAVSLFEINAKYARVVPASVIERAVAPASGPRR